ncbi:SGNH/GDSL hydrolase family protein [Nocardioides panacisoli]|uniref:SGNH/GDSL hydrolase family protein n=1 Tax=Nocardioides panacisoli TaxID=627624 RepID=UPI001C627FD1|nr:SGNH/GDSL hydrolase family protein [Nocardioides panacisoli]QYJ02959.1 SGNH/GDSL hydrolase family protein [Nocardioides panacisoli]
MSVDALIPSHFRRYVALGDSFTEGVGDADPTRPNGVRGWADRVAEQLAGNVPDFGYANLAIRGRKLRPILDEQVEAGIALGPDLVTIHGGGNDVMRPRVDLDDLAAAYADAVRRLRATGATVVMFTLADPGMNPVIKVVRGRTAIFNEWVRQIADDHGAMVVDMWRMRDWKVEEVLDADRLHLNPVGHQSIAIAVLDALRIRHDLAPLAPAPVPVRTRRERWQEDRAWARTHLAPWVKRRMTGRSSGDGVSPKRPTLQPIG